MENVTRHFFVYVWCVPNNLVMLQPPVGVIKNRPSLLIVTYNSKKTALSGGVSSSTLPSQNPLFPASHLHNTGDCPKARHRGVQLLAVFDLNCHVNGADAV